MLKRTFSTLFLFCSTCFVSEHVEAHDALLTQIFSNDCECVVDVVDDKVYVIPEKIVPTNEGLFLHVGRDTYVPLPLLFSDSHGCYIQSARVPVTSPCPFCGWPRISGGWKCGNPACPSNQPKPK